MRRVTDRDELLDGPLDDAATLRGNLRDLARVNRHLGGAALSIRAVEALAGDTSDLTILDVGTGAADIPLAMLDHAGRSGRSWRVTGVDSRPEVLEAAVRVDARLTSTPGLELTVGDGHHLPFEDDAFDIAHASLVVHHLDPQGVDRLLHEMVRVSRRGVVVNDLVRSRLNLIGARILATVATRNRYTRNDGPLSVARAYTRDEMGRILATAGLEIVATLDGFASHRVAVAAVDAQPGDRA